MFKAHDYGFGLADASLLTLVWTTPRIRTLITRLRIFVQLSGKQDIRNRIQTPGLLLTFLRIPVKKDACSWLRRSEPTHP